MLNYEIQIANSPKNRGLKQKLQVDVFGPQNKDTQKQKHKTHQHSEALKLFKALN